MKIKEAYEPLLQVQFHQIEKGVDNDGWYSNERNDAWLPMAAIKDWSQVEFRNNMTEFRPKCLSYVNHRHIEP